MPLNHVGTVRFFQLMICRYEPASTVLTSNKGFEVSTGIQLWPARGIDR
jgi:hypothetical protein